MFDPAPNLPDDTLIEIVRFSPLIRKSLYAAGLKTIGEIRAMSDDKLRRMRGVGTGSFAYLRKTIGTGAEGEGEMTGPRPAGRPWTLTDDYMLRELLASGMKPRLIAQKLERSIGAIQSRIYFHKKGRKRSTPKA
jgi:hypothetical protein